MADNISSLIPIDTGSLADSETLNNNFNYLNNKIINLALNINSVEKITNKGVANGYCPLDSNGSVPNSFLNNISTTINQQISSLNSQISSLNTQINTVNNQTKSAYKTNNATITLNAWVDLKSWLPADGYYWLVSIDQECNHNGGTPPIFTAYSDVQSAVKVCKPDDDSGRSSCAAGNAKILVGSQRRLRVNSSNKDWTYTLTRIRGAVRLGRI